MRPIYGARLGLSSRTDGGVHAIINTGLQWFWVKPLFNWFNYLITAHVDLTHPYPNTIYKPSFVTDSVNQYLVRNGHEIR